MSIRNIIKNVFAPTIPPPRDRRSSDFQPLTWADPEHPLNFDGECDTINTSRIRGNDGGGNNGGTQEQERFVEQPPMEMKRFKSSRKRGSSHLESSQEALRLSEDSGDLFPASFQVYNPTSEPLPEEASGSDAQFAFPNVRLAIQEVFGGDEDNDNNNDNEASSEAEDDDNEISMEEGRRKYWGGRWFSSLCKSWSGKKQQTIMMFAIIAGFACLLATMFVIMGLAGIHKAMKDTRCTAPAYNQSQDLKVLRSVTWPLHDVASRKLNITFDTMARAHQTWNFDQYDSTEDERKSKKSRKNATGLDKLEYVFELPKVNGAFVNGTILSESYKVAKDILAQTLHENSSMLDILSWKGLAGAVAIEELMLRISPVVHKNVSVEDAAYIQLLKRMYMSIEGVLPHDLCFKSHTKRQEEDLKCNHSHHFRSINGDCNNVINTAWGSQYSPLRRIVEDGNVGDSSSKWMEVINGKESDDDEEAYPSPESISRKMHGGATKLDLNASALLPFWGMFIYHDTVKVAESPVSCCNQHKHLSGHPTAYKIPEGYDTCNQKSVLPFTHGTLTHVEDAKEDMCTSLLPYPAMYPSCNMHEPRSSFNLVTSHIDASNIYGSSPELSNKLRLKKGGKLRVTPGKHPQSQGFLLKASKENETCYSGNPINADIPSCFLSGDPDVNEVAILTALNTLWMRQHNYIAHWLQRHNERWDDERIFQESRRILIAQIQHITYNEFLPEILGKEMMKIGGLALEKVADFYESYDNLVDPTVSNAFAGAVGHFWLSMVNGRAKSVWGKAKLTQDVEFGINKLFYMPKYLVIQRRNLEALIGGFVSLSTKRVGVGISSQLRSLHVHITNSTIDLVKMVIQRERELDIAPYVEWRKLCGFREIKYLHELKDHWDPEAFQNISQVYKHVRQIDLFTGMLAEPPIRSGRVGPTLACLLTDQFLRFKKGDRFWYEGDVYSGHFTAEQLKELRKTTLAKIICDNTDDDFQEIQRWPFLLPTTEPDSATNPTLLCGDSRMPRLNFRVWKERPKKEEDGESKGSEIEEDDDWYDSEESRESSLTPPTTPKNILDSTEVGKGHEGKSRAENDVNHVNLKSFLAHAQSLGNRSVGKNSSSATNMDNHIHPLHVLKDSSKNT